MFRFGWLLATCCVTTLSAGDIYVDNRIGVDINPGTSSVQKGELNGPLKTVTAALRRAGPGDRVILLPTNVPYRESIVIDGRVTQGRPQLPILIEGNGNSLVGTVALQGHGWEYQRDNVYKLDRQVFGQTNVWVAGQPLPRVEGADWTSMLNDPPKSRVGVWDKTLYYAAEPGTNPSDVKMEIEKLPSGIFLYRANHIVIRNLSIVGFAFDGIQIRGPVEGVRVENCHIRTNARAGLAAVNCAQVQVQSSLIERNAKAGIISDRFNQLALDAVNIRDSGKPTIIDQTVKLTESNLDRKPSEWTPVAKIVPQEFQDRQRDPNAKPIEPPLERPASSTPKEEPKQSAPASSTPKKAEKKNFFED